MKAIGWITTTLLITVVCGVINALVYAQLYRWFLIPVGAPVLTTAQLYGVLFAIGPLLAARSSSSSSDEEKEIKWGPLLTKAVAKVIARALLLLSFGWLLHAYIYSYAG